MALRKQAITIQSSQIDSALSDFPVCITRDHLDNEIVDPSGGNAAQADGGDLKFYTDSGLSNRVACEVVKFEHDSSTGAGDAEIEVWVKVTSVSASVDTDIYVSYNETDSQPAVGAAFGRNDTWDANHLGVYHADNESSGATCEDSTGNGNNGLVDADDGPQTDVLGNSNGAWGFDGSFDDVPTDGGGTNLLDNLTAMTVEFWGKTTNATISDENAWFVASSLRIRYDASGFGGGQDDVFQLILNNDTSGQNAYETSANSALAQTWQQIAVTWSDGETPTIYVDGSAETLSSDDGTASGAIDGAAAFLWGSGDANTFDGAVDEGRVSDTKRSAAWVAATHSNLSAPATFATAGTPEDASGTSVVPDDCSHSHTAESPTITQAHQIAPDDCSHSHSAEQPAISQVHQIAPDDAAHAHAAESPSITQTHQITPDDATHAHTAESPAITQLHSVTPDDCAHSHMAEQPTVTQVHGITPNDCLHAHTAESPTVSLSSPPDPADSVTIPSRRRIVSIPARRRIVSVGAR